MSFNERQVLYDVEKGELMVSMVKVLHGMQQLEIDFTYMNQ